MQEAIEWGGEGNTCLTWKNFNQPSESLNQQVTLIQLCLLRLILSQIHVIGQIVAAE